MPDKRSHRGPHPSDEKLFGAEAVDGIRLALTDYSMLLTKGYAVKSALKLVGDRFALTERQRLAVMRSACSDQQLASRREGCVPLQDLAGQSMAVDGYNLLITVEAALSGAMIFRGRDGCCRDLASIHGTYRRVTETVPALRLIGEFLRENKVDKARWLLDSPVSNSGRLKTLIRECAEESGWGWQVELLLSPDAELKQTDQLVATSDSAVLDACKRWTNLARHIVQGKLPQARVLDMTDAGV